MLVIDGEVSAGRSLAQVFEERGYETVVCADARAGFSSACASVPDCVVCALDLPDIDGLWVARRIRTEIGPVSRTPLLLVGTIEETATRVQGLHVGADAFLSKPVTNEEIVAQVEALIAMAKRLKVEGEAPPSSMSFTAAIRGDLSMFPLASILMMFELERRTGTLEVVAESGTRAILVLANGLFATTEINGAPKQAVDVLRQVLEWRAGRFSFHPRNAASMPPPRGSVGALVLEAMRLEDEGKARG